MCAALMDLKQSSTEQINTAIAGKIKKFGSVQNMPPDTRKLVEAGMDELKARRASS